MNYWSTIQSWYPIYLSWQISRYFGSQLDPISQYTETACFFHSIDGPCLKGHSTVWYYHIWKVKLVSCILDIMDIMQNTIPRTNINSANYRVGGWKTTFGQNLPILRVKPLAGQKSTNVTEKNHINSPLKSIKSLYNQHKITINHH